MRALQVITGTHDNVQAGCRRDALQGQRISANAATRRIDNGFAANPHKFGQFGNGQRFVIQRAIVEIGKRVHAQFAENAGMHRLCGQMRPFGLAWLVPPAAAIVENMLVHQRRAKGFDRQRAGDGHDLAGANVSLGAFGHWQLPWVNFCGARCRAAQKSGY